VTAVRHQANRFWWAKEQSQQFDASPTRMRAHLRGVASLAPARRELKRRREDGGAWPTFYQVVFRSGPCQHQSAICLHHANENSGELWIGRTL